MCANTFFVNCVQPLELMAPLQLVYGSPRFEQIGDSNAFAHTMRSEKDRTPATR